jgi:glucose/arabinose dehydrogenase
VVRDGRVQETPFLDLRDAVAAGGERGLLGLAVEPVGDEGQGGRVFVNFTNRQGHSVIARVRRSADDPLVADPSSRRDLMWPDGRAFIEQPFSNHNGGNLVFGPDGYLYVGLGDGGSGGDPMNRAQDPRALLGKMLRIDVGVPDDDARGYRVPPDNPFVDGEPVQALPEIWAFGLRNPWRFSFDRRTGDLYIADVGQNAWEELNIEPARTGRRNYGWPTMEGDHCVASGCSRVGVAPAVEHSHSSGEGGSITGGYVYRGSAIPCLQGRYIYGDYGTHRFWTLRWDGVRVRDHVEITEDLASRLPAASFGEDAAGELYVVMLTGEVFRIDAR